MTQPNDTLTALEERVAKAIALEAGAQWPEDANRYRRYARAAIAALSTDEGRK